MSITDPRHHILFRKIWERKQKKTKKTQMTTMFTPSLASLPLSRSLTGACLARVTRTRRSVLVIISPKITLLNLVELYICPTSKIRQKNNLAHSIISSP